MRNKYTTDAAFVSTDGKTVNYQDLFEAAADYARTRERRGNISEAEAEDLAQDAAIKIWLASKGYDTGKVKSPRSYGYTVAKNRHHDMWKEDERFGVPLSSFEMTDDEGHTFFSPVVDTWRSDEFSADRDITSDETCMPIRELISTLEGADKVTMEMTMMKAKPEAIAETLGCTPTAVAVRLCKLRKKVERVMQENDINYRIK